MALLVQKPVVPGRFQFSKLEKYSLKTPLQTSAIVMLVQCV